MLIWLIAGLSLYLAHLYAHGLLRFAHVGFSAYVGPRDDLGAPARFEGRALRATNNLKENMAFFLVPATLAVALPDVNEALAILGAEIFILSRIVYFGVYLSGISLLRSPLYLTGLIGCGMIFAALF